MMKSRIEQYGLMAAGAAGLLGVTAANTADAGIVAQTGLNIAIPSGGSYSFVSGVSIDIDGGGFDIRAFFDTSVGLTRFGTGPAYSGDPTANSNSKVATSTFSAGDLIQATTSYDSPNFFPNPQANFSSFANDGSGFLGFKLATEVPNGGGGFTTELRYGWLDVEDLDNANRRIVGWGYETDADTAIAAGAVPEPGSLALLALGAVGVMSRRSRKVA